MAFLERIRQLVAGPKPQPKTAASSGTVPDYFRKGTRDKATLARNAAIYESGGLITAAIEAPGRTVLSNGWSLEGDDAAVAQVQAVIDGFDFEIVVAKLVDYAQVHGNGMAEIVPLRGGGVTVQLRDPARFRIRQDPYGNISEYLFVDEDEWDNSRGIPLMPEEMIDLTFDPVPNSPYGRSLVSVAIDEILRDAKTDEGLAKAIERHGFPKYHISVGQPGENVSEADLKLLGTRFKNLDSKNEFVTGPDITIGTIDTGGIKGAAEFDNIFLMRLCSALKVPPEVIGLDAKGSTEATATVRFKAWYDRVAALQKAVAGSISRQLFDRITGRPGAVKLVFNDCNPTDDAAIVLWVNQAIDALQKCGKRPKGEWVAAQLHIDPSDLEDYEKPAPVNPFGQKPTEEALDDAERENARALARAKPTYEDVRDETTDELEAIIERTREKVLKAIEGL